MTNGSHKEADDADFYVEMIAYNLHIMRLLIARDLVYGDRASISRLVERMGYGIGISSPKALEIRDLIGLKTIPTDSNGNWKPVVIELAKFLKVEPDILFPGRLKMHVPLRYSQRLEGRIGVPIQWLIM